MNFDMKLIYLKAQYIDCYADDLNGLIDLPYMSIDNSNNLTIDTCLDSCRNDGYLYAGIQAE